LGLNEAVHHLIPGPPSLQSSNPLSSLAPTEPQGEVDQLAWQFRPDLVSPQGKSALSQVLSYWVEGESDQLLGISKRNSQVRDFPKRGEGKLITFGVNGCVNKQPDSSLLQAQVCGSMAKRLQSPSASVLQFHGDSHAA
jgi:hypothetical protein